MLDNVTSNDRYVKLLIDKVKPRDDRDLKPWRLRCMGYIINLIVKAFLFGTDLDAFELEAATTHDLQQEERQLKHWRKCGPIGKLHNIVMFIRKSPRRIEDFQKIQAIDMLQDFEFLQALADAAIRWNSTSTMMERGLHLKEAIDLFSMRYSTAQHPRLHRDQPDMLTLDQLSEDDWEQIKHLFDLLKLFLELTSRMEGRGKNGDRGAVWETLPAMDLMLEHLEITKTQYANLDATHLFVKASVNNAWDKLDKYYELTSESLVYIAAVVLNPKYKWQYFEKHWGHKLQWITEGRAVVKALWETRYKSQAVLDASAVIGSRPGSAD
jgi:hypothetical protein